MEINVYSFCPGGTGKKIKFCCPECLPHLENLARMVEGGQYRAALAAVENAARVLPDKPCLMNVKIHLLESVESWEESEKARELFFEKHPDNPLALALAVPLTEDVDEAFARFEKAWAVWRQRNQDTLDEELVLAVVDLAGILGRAGAGWASLYFMRMAVRLREGREEELTAECRRLSSHMPLVLRMPLIIAPAKQGMPWTDRYEDARALPKEFQFSAAVRCFAALAEEFPLEPSIRYALAISRLRRGDNEGASAAFREYAEMEEVSFEDASEAWAISALLTEDPLGDKYKMDIREYPLSDFDRVHEAFLAEPRAIGSPQPSFEEGEEDEDEDGVPPKGVFLLLDKPPVRNDAKPTAETLPSVFGVARLYGRQTDREARLELQIADPLRSGWIEPWLSRIDGLGEPVLPDPDRDLSSFSKTIRQLFPFASYLPSQPEYVVFKLEDERRCTEFTDAWCATPLGILDGKTPDEAANNAAYRTRLGAAVLAIEIWLDGVRTALDINRIRARLKLPVHSHIDVDGKDVQKLPVTRWHRVRTEKLSDGELLEMHLAATELMAQRAMITAGEAILNRPSLSKEKLVSPILFGLSRLFEATAEGLKYCEQGRNADAAAGRSCAPWDIREYQLRMARLEPEEARAAFDRVVANREDPVAAAFLEQWLEAAQSLVPGGLPPKAVAETPVVATEGTQGTIWTPESEAAGQAKGKIWVPGMD